MKNRLAAVLTAILVSAGLAGCGSPGTTSPASSAPPPSAASGAQESSSAPSGGGEEGKREVLFWDMQWGAQAYSDAAEKLVEQFNAQNPDIRLAYQSIPFDGYVQNFTTAIASGVGPDMSTGGGSMQHLFAAMGEIMPLDPLLEQWEAEGTLEDIDPLSMSLIRYDGKQIGVPWQYDPRMMWYNRELFERAGVAEMPGNLDEFRETLRRLKAAGVANPLIISGNGNYELLSFWQMVAFEYGGGMVRDGAVIVDSPESRQAFEYVKSLMDEGFIPKDIAGWNGDDANAQFLQGNAAVIWSTGDLYGLAAQQAAGMAGKIAILPRVTEKTINPSNSIMAYTRAKDPEATLAALKWWSENNLPLFTEGMLKKVPARKSFAGAPEIKDDPARSAIIELIIPDSVGNGYPSAELYPQYQTIMGNGVLTNATQRLLLTQDAVDDVAADARAEIEKIMAGGE